MASYFTKVQYEEEGEEPTELQHSVAARLVQKQMIVFIFNCPSYYSGAFIIISLYMKESTIKRIEAEIPTPRNFLISAEFFGYLEVKVGSNLYGIKNFMAQTSILLLSNITQNIVNLKVMVVERRKVTLRHATPINHYNFRRKDIVVANLK